MGVLNESETRTVSSAVGSSATVHTSTIVRLYKSEGTRWREECTGAAAVVTDGSNYIKIVNLSNSSVVFSQELYNNFDYQNPKDWFHTFEIDDCVAGLSFADQIDADTFYQKVQSCKKSVPSFSALPSPPSSSPIPSPRVSAPPVPTTPRETAPPAASKPLSVSAPTTTTNTTSSSGGTLRKKTGFGFGNFVGKISGLMGQKDDSEEPLMISEPSNFRHESSIGWNKDSGFEIRNIPPEWRKLFQAAGIKKSELKNKDTAAFVMNVIEQNGGLDAPPPTSAPPPPPPASRPPGANPPPPPRTGGPPPPPRSGSVPPPPPPNIGGPPPPPMMGGGPPATSSFEAPPPAPPSSSGGSGGSFLDAISKGGFQLNKVTRSESANPPPPSSGLVSTLEKAMEERRRHMVMQADNNEEDDWSDEEWE